MNISIIKNCCGCNACRHSCPRKCIYATKDTEGFIKMQIDSKNCTECGLCMKACPMSGENRRKDNLHKSTVYAAVARNEMVYQRSASGGAFSVFAEYVLKRDGIVFGCGYDKELNVRHMGITSQNELDRIRRSKYVQSDTGDTFVEVKKFLESGKYVLYSGTPCQIAGLRKYLKKSYNNLLLIDIICHGVPSPQMFRENLQYIFQRRKKNITDYEFRLKRQGTKLDTYWYTYKFDDYSICSKPYYHDAYFNSFYESESLNECCYVCPYADKFRQGDITLGDFGWAKNWHECLKEYDDISCIIINTTKAKTVLEEVENHFMICSSKMEYVIYNNKNLLRPTPRPQYRDVIYNDIRKNAYKKWAKQYFCSFRYWRKFYLVRIAANIKNGLLTKIRK